MRQFSFRLLVAIITFTIGVFFASIWFFNGCLKFQEPNVQTIKDSINEHSCSYANSIQISSENEDYAVYSAILSDARYKNEVIVIADYTAHGLIADTLTFNQSNRSLTKYTINDYLPKNKEAQKLEDKLTVEGKVIFLSEKEAKQIFRKNGDGWTRFYKKYPKANGLITFSRIGFNQNQTQALVNVSISCGWLCGEGGFVFLQKENGVWTSPEKVGSWWVS